VDVCICSANLCNEFIDDIDLNESIHNDEPINYNVYSSSDSKGGLVKNSNQISSADSFSKIRDGGVTRNKAGMRESTYKSSRVLSRYTVSRLIFKYNLMSIFFITEDIQSKMEWISSSIFH
jgi:hypothetical protein